MTPTDTPHPQSEFGFGDRVLVAGHVDGSLDADGDYQVSYTMSDGDSEFAYVRAADVRPVPPTPDPRDTALAAVRKLHARDFDRECEECRDVDGAWVPWPCHTIRALDGVTPVPAPPAPTPNPSVTEAAWLLVRHVGRMLDNWAEYEPAERNRSLWTPLHDKSDALHDALVAAEAAKTPDPTQPDPIDRTVREHLAELGTGTSVQHGDWLVGRCDTYGTVGGDGTPPNAPAVGASILAHGWTAFREGDYIVARTPYGQRSTTVLPDMMTTDVIHREIDALRADIHARRAVLALRAEEAAAAAPATTDEGRLEAMCRAAYGEAWEQLPPRSRSEHRAGMHRALLTLRTTHDGAPASAS